MCARRGCVSEETHYKEEAQTHALTEQPSRIQPEIHQGAVVCNKVKLCPGRGHRGKLLSCHFLIGAKEISSFCLEKKTPNQFDKSNKLTPEL